MVNCTGVDLHICGMDASRTKWIILKKTCEYVEE